MWHRNWDEYEAERDAARNDESMDEFFDWCRENDEDPDNPDARDAFKDEQAYREDPMKYYGVSWRDFI